MKPVRMPLLAQEIATMAARMAGYMDEDLDQAMECAETRLRAAGKSKAAQMLSGMRAGVAASRGEK